MASKLVEAAQRRIKEVEYSVNPNCPFSQADAQRYGQALAEIAKSIDTETLTPAIVVARAKDPKSPLNDFFTWDVQLAAEKRWLDEARKLLNHIRVTVTIVDGRGKETIVTRKAWINLAEPDADGKPVGPRAYYPYSAVMASSELRTQAFDQFERSAHRYLELAKSFTDPFLIEAVDDLRKAVDNLGGRLRRRK